jgi:sterol desaturase/sphingolipid hydroxylase (fatty acid hydroxylase superfamily)
MISAYTILFALFVVLFTREVIAPASGAQCDKRWRLYAGFVNGLSMVGPIGLGLLFSNQISDWGFIVLPEAIGAFGKSLVVFLCAAFVTYWWHRFSHHSDRLWRWTHQLHHSPKRIEALTAFYAHPLDAFAAASLNAVVAYVVFGVSPEVVGLVILYVGVFNLIAHTDMKTPYVLGYFIQRPEMHRIHHQAGHHSNNYGLPFIDMMFGTWRNPRQGSVDCGFEPENEFRIREMLLMKNVQD